MIKNIWSRLKKSLFSINDSPHRVAFGFGLGVFAGIMPGMGVLVALFLAAVFKANKASALTGCLLTNTWLSFVTFLLAVKIGAVAIGVKWQVVYRESLGLFKDFHLINFFKLSALKIAWPIAAGYIIVGLFSGVLAYFAAISVMHLSKLRDNKGDAKI